MNLHGLKIFNRVAISGSVTRAADELGLTQPAVTAQIRNLEKELGMPLFAHKGRGIVLTDAGQRLAEGAERLFGLEKEIEADMADFQLGHAGRLRIAATYLPANVLLPEWIARFKKENPAVEVNLTTANSSDAFDQLLNYQADIAICGGSWEDRKGIASEIWFEDELWFVVPKDHPLASQEVALGTMMREPFILREEGSSTRERLFSLCRAYNVNPPHVALTFNGLNETIQAVIAGYGANFVSASAVREPVARGEAARVRVQGMELKNPIALCTRNGERLTPSAETFVEMLRSRAIGFTKC